MTSLFISPTLLLLLARVPEIGKPGPIVQTRIRSRVCLVTPGLVARTGISSVCIILTTVIIVARLVKVRKLLLTRGFLPISAGLGLSSWRTL